MNNNPATCPKCGGSIPTGAPQGLCPRCVLAGVAAPTEVTRTTGPRVAAPPIESVRAAFPQLEILELIGQGGMGVVYKARQPKLDRLVALKILSGNLATDPTFEERFTREARTLAKLNHPNIVTIYDHGRSGEFFYLLMEFVDGVNLRQAMAAGRFTASEALALVPRICEALQYAHEEGVLHRDIKPENILLDGRGRVKIADFGIAKMLGEAQPGGTLTASGAALGTPHYMSPEQIEHPSEVDHRTDIFSLGVVFYEMLTGELPLGRFGPPSAKSAVDRRVDEIVFRTLEKERELRQQSAGEVRSQVETVAARLKSGAAAPRSGFSKPTAPLRTGTAYASTPEHLKTFWGGQYIYTGKGALTLDRERLTFVRDSTVTTIPLKSITGLTLGTYPRLTKPTGLNYIAVAFDEAGAKRLLLFTPHRSPWDATWTTNSVVADWHQVLREATAHAQGREPEPVPAELLHVPENFRHIVAPILLFLALFIGGLSVFGLVLVFAKGGLKGLSGMELLAIAGAMLWVAVIVGVLLFIARKLRPTAPEPSAPMPDHDTPGRPNQPEQRVNLSALFNLWKPDGSFDVWKLVAWAVFAWTGTQLIGALSLFFGAGFGLAKSSLFNSPLAPVILGSGVLLAGEIAIAAGVPFGQWRTLVKRTLTTTKVSLVLLISFLLLSRVELAAGDFIARLLVRLGLVAAIAAVWLFDRRRWPEAKTRPAMFLVPMLCLGLLWGRFLPYSAGGLVPPPSSPKLVNEIFPESPISASPPVIPLEIKPASPPPMQDPIRDIELKVAKQQLEKTLNELADAQLELATSESMQAYTERHPAKKALLERLRYLEERSAILRKELEAGSADPDVGKTAIREVELRVARDQYEKTLTALVEAKKELATSQAMLSYSDNHPTKKALLTKIQFLEERQAVLKKELSSAPAEATQKIQAATPKPTTIPSEQPAEPLAHLTNALRVKFFVPARTKSRFLLFGPPRPRPNITVAIAHNPIQAAALKPLERGESYVEFLDTYGPRSIRASEAFPYVDATIGMVPQRSPLSAVIVSSDKDFTEGELIWEPMRNLEDGTNPYPTWRLWIAISNQPPIGLHTTEAPWKLPLRFVWPKGLVAGNAIAPGKETWATPLHLDPQTASQPQTSVHGLPGYFGPDFGEFRKSTIAALADCKASVLKDGSLLTNQLDSGRGWITDRAIIWFGGIPPTIWPRMGVALERATDLFSLSQSDFVSKYPTNGFGQSARPTYPIYLERDFFELAKTTRDTLKVVEQRENRPQSEYFPNDRVRIGLLANEAEILAAIRNGSTNQIFNQPQAVKP